MQGWKIGARAPILFVTELLRKKSMDKTKVKR
jgi:hypothetical protein